LCDKIFVDYQGLMTLQSSGPTKNEVPVLVFMIAENVFAMKHAS
jgi:hypothetical protein